MIAFRALCYKNEGRLRHDGACAYLEKSALGLDKGCDTLWNGLAAILGELGLEVPTRPRPPWSCGRCGFLAVSSRSEPFPNGRASLYEQPRPLSLRAWWGTEVTEGDFGH